MFTLLHFFDYVQVYFENVQWFIQIDKMYKNLKKKKYLLQGVKFNKHIQPLFIQVHTIEPH